MVHRAFKPYSLLMYFLAIIACFFLGLLYAKMVEAGKGQMLAGGAIFLGYGVIGSAIGLILALFVAKRSNRKTIIKTNIVLTISIVLLFGFFHIRYKKRQKEKEKEAIEFKQPSTKVSFLHSDTNISF